MCADTPPIEILVNLLRRLRNLTNFTWKITPPIPFFTILTFPRRADNKKFTDAHLYLEECFTVTFTSEFSTTDYGIALHIKM